MKNFKSSAIALSLVLVLGACGGAEKTEAASEDEGMESPIAEYLGVDLFSFGPDGEAEAAINTEIASCMQAEGFEWTPPDSGEGVAFEFDPDGLEYGSEEWVAKYGFGISTLSFAQEQVGPNLVGHSWSDIGVDEDTLDPNQQYLDSLTEPERDAYYEALYGTEEGPEMSEDMTEDEMEAAFREWEATRVISGCEPKAYEGAYGGGIAQAFYDEFGPEMEDIYETMQDDPRIVAAEQKVADCVTEQGLEFTSMDDVDEDFRQRLEPINESMIPDFPEVTEEMITTMTEDELNALFVEPELDDPTKELLGEIQADELRLAASVFECGGEAIFGGGTDSLYEEVYLETEQRFLDENQARIETFKAEYEAANSGS